MARGPRLQDADEGRQLADLGRRQGGEKTFQAPFNVGSGLRVSRATVDRTGQPRALAPLRGLLELEAGAIALGPKRPGHTPPQDANSPGDVPVPSAGGGEKPGPSPRRETLWEPAGEKDGYHVDATMVLPLQQKLSRGLHVPAGQREPPEGIGGDSLEAEGGLRRFLTVAQTGCRRCGAGRPSRADAGRGCVSRSAPVCGTA